MYTSSPRYTSRLDRASFYEQSAAIVHGLSWALVRGPRPQNLGAAGEAAARRFTIGRMTETRQKLEGIIREID